MKKLNSILLSALIIFSLLTSCTEDEPQIKITSFSFDAASVEVIEGTSVNLNDHLTIEGEDASKAEVSFTSDNEEVVTVDGVTLTAVGVGNATIEATETNTNKSATIAVTVIAANIAVTGVSLNEESVALQIGQTFQLAATIAPEDATEKELIWSVEFPSEGKSNETAPSDIATVSEEGLVTAVSPGEVNVVVKTKDGDFTASTSVVISGIPATGVTLNQNEANLEVGETVQLTATIAPENATEKGVTWSVAFPSASKNNEVAPTDIATVTETGLVTAVSAGSVVVTVTTTDGEFTASASISITNVAVTGVAIGTGTGVIEINGTETIQLNATITPSNAFNQAVSWSVEFTNVGDNMRTNFTLLPEDFATVDQNGAVTGGNPCNACVKVVATVVDGDNTFTASADINIIKVLVTSITLDPASFTVDPNGTQQITATILPVNASPNEKKLYWNVAHVNNLCDVPPVSNYASVDQNGLVTGIAAYSACGGINVTATSENGEGSVVGTANFSVNSILATGIEIYIDGQTITDKKINLLNGSSVTLLVNFTPTTTSNKTLTWTVTDTNGNATMYPAVSVDGGVVTTLLNDESRVTVTNEASGQTDYIDINVVVL
ncbi:Ig-like domain-containing protein [Reichenbachiella sp.]|uniref:Ig-like domain-containing protein n=1 Tax=Reichenbachiella sp. TaxID=2184521 RepID=UPI0032996EF2